MKLSTQITAFALMAALAACSANNGNPPDGQRKPAGSPAAATAPAAAADEANAFEPIAPLAAGAPNYRAIVEQYGPAVVGVTVDGSRKVDNTDDLPSEFYRNLPGFSPTPPRRDVPFRGQGSGFIISADGLILTNAHVVREASAVTVKLQDRREYRAKVVGADPATDIAVLKIDARHLPVVKTGDPKKIAVGDYVLAIGAPFGFESTATQGIVSAKRRELPGESYVPFIQTDAAVNPGNSGGPLFDANGRVIGINAQIYSSSGGFQGLAFAVPIDLALKMKDQLVANGHIDHARLGVSLQDLNQSLAESFGLETPDGAVITSVVPDTPAARAHLQPGDVITEVNGQPVQSAGDVSNRVGTAAPGDMLRLRVWRSSSARPIDVKLDAVTSSKTERVARHEAPGQLGLRVRPLTRDEKREARTDHGLLVRAVEGAAAHAGIQPGDVLLAFNGRPVSTVQELHQALDARPKRLALLIQRDDQRIYVPIDLG